MYILCRVFHILTQPVPYTFVGLSVNWRNDAALQDPHCNVINSQSILYYSVEQNVTDYNDHM